MQPECRTTQVDAQPIVGVRTTTSLDKIAEVMGPLFGEVYGYIQQNGQAPSGMPLAIYHAMDGDTVDVECALPVAAPLAGTARIQAGELPAGTVATVTHLGPYDNLKHMWSALIAWMQTEGLHAAAAPWEVYVTDPGAEPDQSKWRTDIYFPIRCQDSEQAP